MSKHIILQFHADWCGPCRVVTPILREIVEESRGTLSLVRTDVDKYPTDAAKWEVKGIPTVIHLDEEGNEIARMVGAQPKTLLKKNLKLAG